MSGSNFMLGAGLVFVFVGVIVVIFIVVLNARPAKRGKGPSSARSGTVDLNAKVSCSPTEIKVTNLDPFAWKDVKVGINTRDGKGGFWARVKRDEEKYTEPGLYVTLPYSRFENSAGDAFDATGEDVRNIFIKATTSEGPGECKVTRK